MSQLGWWNHVPEEGSIKCIGWQARCRPDLVQSAFPLIGLAIFGPQITMDKLSTGILLYHTRCRCWHKHRSVSLFFEMESVTIFPSRKTSNTYLIVRFKSRYVDFEILVKAFIHLINQNIFFWSNYPNIFIYGSTEAQGRLLLSHWQRQGHWVSNFRVNPTSVGCATSAMKSPSKTIRSLFSLYQTQRQVSRKESQVLFVLNSRTS